MPVPEDAITEGTGGVVLSLEVSPGSDRDEFPAGYNPWRNTLLCRTRSPPREGRANKAIIAVISKRLDISSSSVTVVAGARSPFKKVRVEGLTKEGVLEMLAL
jgi:uncharacterized protein